jgi:hypothetical protein
MLKNKFGFCFVFVLGALICADLWASEKSSPSSTDIILQHRQQLQKIVRFLPEKTRKCLPPDLLISEESQKSNQVLAGNGTISGRVTEAAGGGGIYGVIVRAHLCECPSYNNYDTTNANGDYAITNLPGGKYIVWTDNDSVFTDVYYNDKPSQDADTVMVVSGNMTPGINFYLRVGAKITGLLTMTGSPYVLAFVEAVDTLTHDYYYAQPFSIGDTATYVVMRLPTGIYRLKTFNMIGYIDEYYDDKPDAASATIISVTEGNIYSSNNITLDRGGVISGTITGSEPLNHIQVFAYYVPNKSEWLNMTGLTNVNGVYRLTGLRSGDWKLFCYGDSTYAWEWYNNAGSWDNATNVTVSAPDSITGKDFSLEVGGSISGHVYGEGTSPLAGVDVVAFDSSFVGENLATKKDESSDNGSYIITGLRTSFYYVGAFTECNSQFYNYRPNIQEADLVAVIMPEHIAGMDFYFGYFLRGDVNKDYVIDVGDIVYLMNYLFKSGSAPAPLELGDTNCDGKVDVGDIVVLINYLFKGGAAPSC